MKKIVVKKGVFAYTGLHFITLILLKHNSKLCTLNIFINANIILYYVFYYMYVCIYIIVQIIFSLRHCGFYKLINFKEKIPHGDRHLETFLHVYQKSSKSK